LLDQDVRRVTVGNGSELIVEVPYAGLTPHAWTARFEAGDVELRETRRRPAEHAGVGTGGSQEFRFGLGPFQETTIAFDLRTPWDPEPADSRRLILRR